jgi:cell division transport system permease protein
MPVSSTYAVRETSINLRRNLVMTVAAILTMSVSLFLVASALIMRQATKKASIQWRGGVELAIFLAPDVSPGLKDAIGHQLESMPNIKKIKYVDKAGAYQEFKTMFANTPDLVNSLSQADMPPSFRVVPTRAEDVDAIGHRFNGQPGVKNVAYAKEVIASLIKDYNKKVKVAVGIAVGVSLGAIALIVNTIQLAVFARRREVAVMKLVGATNWFIRIPFMMEGLTEGLLGALGAFGLAYVFRDTIASFVSSPSVTGGSALYVTPTEAILSGVVVLVLGCGVGAAGSAFAVRRFLSV